MYENTVMSANIKNKSNHPVEIKKIGIDIWTLRSEIESAIEKKIQQGNESDISDIKNFYEAITDTSLESLEVQVPNESIEETSNNEEEEATKEKFQRVFPSKKISGHSFLADINMEGILFFSMQKFTHGQSVIINFNIPKDFSVSAQVIKSVDIASTSRIISETKPRYRILAKFVYYFENEKDQLRSFLQSIEPTRPEPIQKVNKESQDMSQNDLPDDDEFGDLDL